VLSVLGSGFLALYTLSSRKIASTSLVVAPEREVAGVVIPSHVLQYGCVACVGVSGVQQRLAVTASGSPVQACVGRL
jgi:hypothetical protein